VTMTAAQQKVAEFNLRTMERAMSEIDVEVARLTRKRLWYREQSAQLRDRLATEVAR
jgi:hypothetical protein